MKPRSRLGNTQSPHISVIMSVYNGEVFIADAIDSILGQTYKDFELIIIDDGSTDTTSKILDNYSDPRIVRIKQANHGLIYSLNRGIKHSKAALVARHDADDVSSPDRFKKQFQVLNDNPEVSVVASSFNMVDMNGRLLFTFMPPLNDIDIRRQMFIRNPLCHGSVMMRKTAIQRAGYYSEQAVVAEDYDLWIRLAQSGCAFQSIPEPLYNWRHNSSGVSWNNEEQQRDQVGRMQNALWNSTEIPTRTMWSLVVQAWQLRVNVRPYGAALSRQLALDQFRLARLSLRRRRYIESTKLAVTYVLMIPFNITSGLEQFAIRLKKAIQLSRHFMGQTLSARGLR